MIDRPAKLFYEFDQFRIDIDERQLLAHGEKVQLTPKVFDILLALVENHGHTVEKDKLMERVWADANVEEGSLNRNISTLRKILGEDSHKPRLIKTVPKRGYRFEGNIREVIEDEETVTVERRTNYSLAITSGSETETEHSSSAHSWSQSSILAASLVACLLIVLAWNFLRSPANSANSFASSAAAQTRNGEAMELYRRARSLWENRSVEGLHQATMDLEQAIRIDPQFALAHAALADAYAFDTELWKKAEASANEALRLDPSLGQPHATIGFVRMFWEWRIEEAEEHLKEALKLSPDYATAHQWYAFSLMFRNNSGSAIAEIKRALELHPASVSMNGDLCQLLYFSKKYDEAISQCRKTLEIDPNYIPAHQHLYRLYNAKGMYPEAVDAFLKTERLNITTATPPDQLEYFRKVFVSSGIRGFWKARIKVMLAQEQPFAYVLGQHYAWLGKTDEALFWFKRAAENREFDFLYFKVDPLHQKYFGDPRAKELAAILSN